MGAVSFETFVKKDSSITNASEAFYKANKDAKYAYGNGLYSASIAEKDSFKEVGRADNVNEACYMAMKILDMPKTLYDRWGPAGCIAISKSKLTGEKTIVKKKIKAFSAHEAKEKFYNSLSKNLKTLGPPVVHLEQEGKAKFKVNDPKEEIVLRYVLEDEYVFDSRSKAIAAAKKLALKQINHFRYSINKSVKIKQEKVLAGTNRPGLIEIFVEKEDSIFEVSSEVEKIQVDRNSTDGWYFFGIAHC